MVLAGGEGKRLMPLTADRAKPADPFGVIDADAGSRTISAFREKPADAQGLPDAPHEVFASMGNYVFTTSVLVDAVTRDAQDPDSKHDMGGSIVPMLVARGEAAV